MAHYNHGVGIKPHFHRTGFRHRNAKQRVVDLSHNTNAAELVARLCRHPSLIQIYEIKAGRSVKEWDNANGRRHKQREKQRVSYLG